MGITMLGSMYIAFHGESRGGWLIYIIAASVGILYFALLWNPSQLLLVIYFGIMNVIAFIRLTLKKRKHLDDLSRDINK